MVTLPSVDHLTLGKHGHFAECRPPDTRQTWSLCRVFLPWHSTNYPVLPSARWLTLGKLNANGSSVRHGNFALPSVEAVLGKLFAECPIKDTWQSVLCRYFFYRAHFAECYTRQKICRVFFKFCWVPGALGKATYSSSACWGYTWRGPPSTPPACMSWMRCHWRSRTNEMQCTPRRMIIRNEPDRSQQPDNWSIRPTWPMAFHYCKSRNMHTARCVQNIVSTNELL